MKFVPVQDELEMIKSLNEQQLRESGMNEYLFKYKYIIGEWFVDENGYFQHKNYGSILNDPIIRFSSSLEQIL